ncbi:hypothetical protein QBC46DRAFT_411766 [Diplogelasinospora grovesii]|uniref:Uncharacterized protein n=1 Tax=Diplogelasinospora grovesii TaxID=303347 RepID=A0AAN6N0B0_9PEZI|nr:hypothetical protein QBC46DRAFT_411766 [Diplogelasinospora grovesii]
MDEKQPEHPMAERMEGPDGLPPPLCIGSQISSPPGPVDKRRDPTAWGRQALDWAVRAGFFFAPRREILIKAHDSGEAIGQVLKFTGQRNPKVLLHLYLDNMCTIDGAAVFLSMNPRRDLTADFRSATMKRSAQLPQTLPSEAKAELEKQEDYVDLTEELERLGLQSRSVMKRQTADQLKAERRRLYEKRR